MISVSEKARTTGLFVYAGGVSSRTIVVVCYFAGS